MLKINYRFAKVAPMYIKTGDDEMGYKPTCHIKWVEIHGDEDKKPTAIIKSDYNFDDKLYCLKQLWVSDFTNEPDQWRDIEVQE